MKIVILDVNSGIVAWIREFLLGGTQRVNVGGQLSGVVKITCGV